MTQRAMHIAVALPDFSSGGTERTAIRLADAWVQRGRRVTILCGSERGPARALVAPGVTVLSPRPAIQGGPFYRARLGRAFARFVSTISPDLVFGIGNFHVPVLAWMRMALPGQRPLLVCRLSNRLHQRGLDWLSQMLFSIAMRLGSRRIDAIVAMSDALMHEARVILGRDDVASIAEPNLPDGYISRRDDVDTAAAPLIVCAGRLERQKRFELALAAFAALPPRRDARLLILGDGSRRAALERAASKLGVSDRVEFAGYVADIQPHLARAQIFLCTSRYEGYPAVLVEAVAAGSKIVTTDCSPAIAEIMFDRSFGCVAESRAAALAQAIDGLLDAPGPECAARKRLIAKHQTSRSAEAYLAFFDALVAARTAH